MIEGMSTIEALDKLREWANVRWEPWAESRERLHRMLDEIEAEIAERLMELPIDADGVPIHMGDVVELGENRNQGIVKALNGHMVIAMHVDDGYMNYAKYGLLWNADECRHVKPRTLEDVLTEMLDRNTDGVGLREFNRDFGAFVAHYAEEIRELMGAEVDDD